MIQFLIFLLFLISTIHYRVELSAFSVALIEPVVLLVSGTLLLYQLGLQRRLVIRKDPLLYCFIGVTLWTILILPWSPDWRHSLSDVRDWFIPILSFVALTSSIRRGWRQWLILFVLLAVINASVGIYQHLTNTFRPFAAELSAFKTSFSLSPDRSGLAIASPAVGFFSHPNGFAIYILLAILLVLGWQVKGQQRWVKVAVISLLFIALCWTYAKASLLVMPFSIVEFGFARRMKSWGQFLVVSAGLMVIGGAIAWFVSQQVPPAYLATFWWRVRLWQTALEVIRDNPAILLVGNGLEMFSAHAIYPQPHNLYIYLVLAYGLPGLGLVLGIAWHLLRRGWVAHRHRLFRREPLLDALWIGLMGYFAIGLVESNLLGIEQRMIFLTAAACFVGLWHEVSAES